MSVDTYIPVCHAPSHFSIQSKLCCLSTNPYLLCFNSVCCHHQLLEENLSLIIYKADLENSMTFAMWSLTVFVQSAENYNVFVQTAAGNQNKAADRQKLLLKADCGVKSHMTPLYLIYYD